METLQDVVSKLKVNFSKKLEIDLLTENYGLKSCLKDPFNEFSSDKLEIIFLSNLSYLDLKENQMKKILKRNYKGLLKRKVYPLDTENIELEVPAIVNNTQVTQNITNVNTTSITEEDTWDQTDW